MWDPETGLFSDVSLEADVFCSGHSVLPDGRLFVSGGNDTDCSAQGIDDTHLFDPSDESWTFVEDMVEGRWYPSHTTLGDGRIIITSGNDVECQINAEMEMYTPGEGVTVVPSARAT